MFALTLITVDELILKSLKFTAILSDNKNKYKNRQKIAIYNVFAAVKNVSFLFENQTNLLQEHKNIAEIRAG